MKKILILIFLIVLAIPMRVYAADLSLSVSEQVATEKTVRVMVSLNDAVAVKSGYVAVSYDKTKLEHISNVFELSESPSISGTIGTDSAFAYSNETIISGELISIYFTIKNTFEYDECDVRVEVMLKDENDVSTALAATIEIDIIPNTTAAETTTETTTMVKEATSIRETTSADQETDRTTTARETTTVVTTSETTIWNETTTERVIAIETTTEIATTVTTPSLSTAVIEQTEWQTTNIRPAETTFETNMTFPTDVETTVIQTKDQDNDMILIVGITVICNLIIITVTGAAIYLIKKETM